MTAAQPRWTPHPRDLQSAVATFTAHVKDGKRPAAMLMRMAGNENRLYVLVDSLMWLLYKHLGLDDDPEGTKLGQLEDDLLALAGMVAEIDAEENR